MTIETVAKKEPETPPASAVVDQRVVVIPSCGGLCGVATCWTDCSWDIVDMIGFRSVSFRRL